MSGPTRCEPSRHVYAGFQYVPSTHTDIRALFKRIRSELGIPQPKPANKPRKK